MINQIIVVGRLALYPQKNEAKESEKGVKITLAVPRSYRNIDGIYETDFITCLLLGSIGDTTLEYCKKGDLIGIKGRVQRTSTKDEMEIIAEKVTFLSGK